MNTNNQTNFELDIHNCEVDASLREHLEDKIEGLERMWSRVDDAHTKLSGEHGRFVAEVTLISGGLQVRGEETADNLRLALDNALEKIERQLRRHKKKALARQRRSGNRELMSSPQDVGPALGNELVDESALGGVTATEMARGDDESQNGENDEEIRMVRVKRFSLKPMSPEEASLQMDLLGHTFFVFRDADSDEIGVVYKRHDGDYGLITPDSA